MKLGKYKHYKGNIYEVIGLAKHSETLEEMVVYKTPNEDKLWVRPKKMFLEEVKKNGKTMKRFQFFQDSSISQQSF